MVDTKLPALLLGRGDYVLLLIMKFACDWNTSTTLSGLD